MKSLVCADYHGFCLAQPALHGTSAVMCPSLRAGGSTGGT